MRKVSPGQVSEPPHHEKRYKGLSVKQGKLFFSPELARPGDNMICLKTEPAELQGDWKPSPEGRTGFKARCPARALRTAQPGGQAGEPWARPQGILKHKRGLSGAGLWNSAANVRWASLSSAGQGWQHRISLISILAFCPWEVAKGHVVGKADSPPPNTAFPCGHIGSYFSPHMHCNGRAIWLDLTNRMCG